MLEYTRHVHGCIAGALRFQRLTLIVYSILYHVLLSYCLHVHGCIAGALRFQPV